MENKKNNKKVILLLTIFLIVIIIITCIWQRYLIKYTYANLLVKQERYESALSIFKTIENYKDVKDKIKECTYQNVLIFIEENKYNEAMTLITDIIGYKDFVDLYKKIKYMQAKQFINEYDYDNAIKNLDELNDYKDSKELLLETKYKKANDLYNTENFSEAGEIFKTLDSYKDSNDYISKIEKAKKIYGLKMIGSGSSVVKISKNSCTLYIVDILKEVTKETYSVTMEGDILKLDDKYTIYLKNNSAYINMGYAEYELFNASRIPYYPEVGMSDTEVKNSTWGRPQKINKTNTAYGISEQWVYDGYKYIYLTNGIVNSIQD
ncbi:MAG: hypothetical protein N2749_06230 [Clostridia bacterium]|nr:hypothetical protein [Clostridia bacterium]